MKYVIVLILLSIALTVGYYFAWYLPQANATQQEIANKAKCVAVGEVLYQQDKKQDIYKDLNNPNAFSSVHQWAKYAYNPNLNTCLYETMVSSQEGSQSFNWEGTITDSFTNSVVLDSGFISGDLLAQKDQKTVDAFTNFFIQADNLMGSHVAGVYTQDLTTYPLFVR